MESEKTIFEVLFKKEICFAVNVSEQAFKSKGIDMNSKDWWLIIQKQDLNKLKDFQFFETIDYPNVFEYDLSVDEVAEFKTNMDKFIKVHHNEYGRTYELKNNSFKELHESNK